MEEFDGNLDSHALRVLVTVCKSGSFTAAAHRLGLNQSTVSYTIGRLRETFGDELFVRAGRGIRPTQRSEEIAAEAERLLRDLARLAAPPSFDPASTRDRVVISCNFYERTVILPDLLRRLRAEAPGLRISIIQSHTHGHRQLLADECDLLISPLLPDLAGLYTRVLFAERYACFVDRDSRAAREGLTLDQYTRADHVMVNYDGGWKPFYRETLKSLNIDIVPKLELPSFGMVHRLIEGTNLVLTAPSALAPAMGESCARIDAPFECRFNLHLFWSGRAHQTPLNRWLRDRVVQAAKAVASRLEASAASQRPHSQTLDFTAEHEK